MRFLRTKLLDEIFTEWDQLAPTRLEQILSGKDVTYQKVLTPELIRISSPKQDCEVLDAGCGVGVFSAAIAPLVKSVVGVDPSQNSIKIAKSKFSATNISFQKATLEEYVSADSQPVDLVIANMTLACVLDLTSFLSAVFKALKHGGRFAFSLPHPCFWPRYYGYEGEPSFDYTKPTIVECPFRISNDESNTLMSTHIHRPLSMYIKALEDARLHLQAIAEPMPSADVAALYPRAWDKPRYIFGLCGVV
jgi:2-polyprenyl-3-methyl-5-hydroxy-6-metoxy-1,4-benzoquinol methylase